MYPLALPDELAPIDSSGSICAPVVCDSSDNKAAFADSEVTATNTTDNNRTAARTIEIIRINIFCFIISPVSFKTSCKFKILFFHL